MRIHLAVLRTVSFMVLATRCSFAEGQKIVKRMVIHSGGDSLGQPYNTVVVIQWKGDKFLSNGQPLSTVQVLAIAVALLAPNRKTGHDESWHYSHYS